MSENTNNTNNTNNDNIEIGALWKKQGKSQKFLSGTINLKSIGYDKDVPVIVFTNKFKQKDSHPDLRIYLSKPKTTSVAVSAPAVKQEAPILKEKGKAEAPEPVAVIDEEVF